MIRSTVVLVFPLLLGSAASAQFPSSRIILFAPPDVRTDLAREVGNNDVGGKASQSVRSRATLGADVDIVVQRRRGGGDMARIVARYRNQANEFREHEVKVFFDGNNTHIASGVANETFSTGLLWLSGSGGANTRTFANVGGYDVRLQTRFAAAASYSSSFLAEFPNARGSGYINNRLTGVFSSCNATNLDGGWASATVRFSVDQSNWSNCDWSLISASGVAEMRPATYDVYCSVTAGPFWSWSSTTREVASQTAVFGLERRSLE